MAARGSNRPYVLFAGIYFVSHSNFYSLFFRLEYFQFFRKRLSILSSSWRDSATSYAHFTLLGKLADGNIILYDQFGSADVGNSIYADSNTDEYGTAAAILMGLYWSLPI